MSAWIGIPKEEIVRVGIVDKLKQGPADLDVLVRGAVVCGGLTEDNWHDAIHTLQEYGAIEQVNGTHQYRLNSSPPSPVDSLARYLR